MTDTPILATIENMKTYYDDEVSVGGRCFAFSPYTFEEYSADPDDYFMMRAGEMLHDAEGNPMELVIRRISIIPVNACWPVNAC
jgi:hypothetical protein